jgi:hypothetical protein
MSLSVVRCALWHVESSVAVLHRSLDRTRTSPSVRYLWVLHVVPVFSRQEIP